ncbi:8820_t:CDS:2 [Gigaspora margarita]|uniref:8820_t:CDS:1 n=1 Tax=Gigaspora margarita TaxID=4874 RepID=A0ABN7UWS6_GIGMA|nr:8820_t:CDS:2 [Gigaspora margarita]
MSMKENTEGTKSLLGMKKWNLTRDDMKTNESPDQFGQTGREIMQEEDNQSSLTITPGPRNDDIRDELGILGYTKSEINHTQMVLDEQDQLMQKASHWLPK